MLKTDPLFLLIKSMTKAEKRSFKIDATKFRSKRNKSFIRLFDAVEAQREYDEQALKKKLKDDGALKQFRYVKMYLHRYILKSLKNFHDEASGNLKLAGYLAEIEILYNKELFKSCANTIKKAKACAEKYEIFTKLQELINWEAKIEIYLNDSWEMRRVNPKFIEEERKVLAKCSEIIDLQEVAENLLPQVMRKGPGRSEEEKKLFRQFLSLEVIKNKSGSFSGELKRLSIRATCAISAKNYDEIYQAYGDMLAHYDRHPHQVEERISIYFDTIICFTRFTITSGKFIVSNRLLAKGRNFYRKWEEKINLADRVAFLQTEMLLLLKQGELTAATHIYNEINKIVKTSHKKLGTRVEFVLNYLCFELYFRNKDYKNAQYYIQKIINRNSNIALDMQSWARVFNLILQYEQEEYHHLGYILRSTYRYLVQKDTLYEPEKIILDFIRRALEFTSEKQLFIALGKLKQQMVPLLRDAPFVIDFPLIEWIDSKLQKRELAEIVRENYLAALSAEEQRGEERKIAV